MKHRSSTAISAFTLLEISIVLAVLGILLGGIFGAQLMIRNQRLKQIPEQAAQYHVAVEQFKLKYNFYPGDFPTASSVWTTTDGDGNGLIDSSEPRYVWSQLSSAGLAVGQFGTATPPTPGTDIPAGPIEGTGYSFAAANSSTSLVTADSSTAVYDADYAAAIYFGKTLAAGTYMRDPALPSRDAALLDQGYDDGVPSTGKILTWKSTAPSSNTTSCTTSSTEYDKSIESPNCAFIFLNAYSRAERYQ